MASEEIGIRVVCRVRPPLPNSTTKTNASKKDLNLVQCRGNEIIIGLAPETRSFVFDYVADTESTQDDMWQNVGLEVCQSSLGGYHGTIIAYGQTGSGKTHTIFGDDSNPQDRGIVPRALDYIFSFISSEQLRVRSPTSDSTSDGREAKSYIVTAQMIEIYNERVYDLLDQSVSGSADTGRPIQLREDPKRGVFVEGAVEEEISSPTEAHKLLNIGNKNRHVAATVMNRTSSRSHAIFMLMIQMTAETLDGVKTNRLSRFNLVDLAGSERQKATQTTGLQLREAGQINKSLSALGNVIHALTSGTSSSSTSAAADAVSTKTHVSYRDSKLTYLLRDSLGGNSKTIIVATVTTQESSMSESLTTLKFAVRAKRVKNRVSKNEEIAQGTLLALQREVLSLRAQLASLVAPEPHPHLLAWDVSIDSADSPDYAHGSPTRKRSISGGLGLGGAAAGLPSPKGARGFVDYRDALTAALQRCQAADELRFRAEMKSREMSREVDSYCSILSYKALSSAAAPSAAEAAAALEVSRLRAALEELQRRMRWTLAESDASGMAVAQHVWDCAAEDVFSHKLLTKMQEERVQYDAMAEQLAALQQVQVEQQTEATRQEMSAAQARVAQLEDLVKVRF